MCWMQCSPRTPQILDPYAVSPAKQCGVSHRKVVVMWMIMLCHTRRQPHVAAVRPQLNRPARECTEKPAHTLARQDGAQVWVSSLPFFDVTRFGWLILFSAHITDLHKLCCWRTNLKQAKHLCNNFDNAPRTWCGIGRWVRNSCRREKHWVVGATALNIAGILRLELFPSLLQIFARCFQMTDSCHWWLTGASRCQWRYLTQRAASDVLWCATSTMGTSTYVRLCSIQSCYCSGTSLCKSSSS